MNTHPTRSFQGYTHPTSYFQSTGPVKAPTVEFVNSWRHGLPPAQVPRALTGRNIMTGELMLGIGIRSRCNGTTAGFECDLWKLNYDLNALAIERLQNHRRLLNEHTPAKVRARMQQHFSRTFLQFDTMAKQAHEWRRFLKVTLSDADSYVGIGGSMPGQDRAANRSWQSDTVQRGAL